MKKILKILTVANILLFIISVCCLIWTTKNNQIFNSIGKDFSYEEYENGKVILLLKGDKEITLIFGNTSVRVVDSYQTTSMEGYSDKQMICTPAEVFCIVPFMADVLREL